MRNEMEILGMDAPRRLAWLRANRATLMIVGLAWLGLISWEFLHGRAPWFLILMVPVFAALRFLLYLHYRRREPSDGQAQPAPPGRAAAASRR